MKNVESFRAALADRYAIEAEIDAGGMATVYRARDLKHDRTVAIKVLRPDLAEAIGADRFLREIRTTANLSHPHILPLHDSGEADGLLYYVMPFLEGESLADRLDREGQLPVEDAVQIAREVAEALDYAHEKGVTHRDIKPANILLERGHALLADFGIAQAKASADETRLTGMGMSPGTPAYMSPEQISGQGKVDGRSDQYALACVLYEMLAGHPPFTAENVQTVMRQHLAAVAPKVTGARTSVPAGVAKAVHRALAKGPADRFRAMAEFEKALAGATLPLLARIPMRRARGVGYSFVAVAAVAIGIWIWGTWNPGGGSNPDTAWQPDPNRIAVAPFENRTGDAAFDRQGEWIAGTIEERLSGAMIGDLVPAARVIPTLQAAGVEADPVTILSRDLGAGTVVSGDIYLQGDSLEIRASCIDAATGGILTPLDPVRGAPDELDALVAEIGNRVAGALAMLLDPVSSPIGVIGAPPQNPEAYEEYRRGVELRAFSEDKGEAADHFLRAWALDSTFYTAAIEAFVSAPQDSVLAYLIRSESRMTRAERYLFHVYTRLLPQGGTEGALGEARSASELYPREFAYLRGFLALARNRVREAVDAFSLWEREGGGFLEGYVRYWPLYFQYYADALHRLGEHDKELDIVLEGMRRYPDFPGFVEAELWARIGLGQTDQVRSMIIDMRREGGPLSLRFVVQELIAQGMDELARELLEAEVERFATDSFYISSGSSRYYRGRYLHYLGRDEEAHALLEESSAEHPGDPGVLLWVGITAAAVGDTAQALEVEAWLEEHAPETSVHTRGYIRATLGDRQGAVTLLEKYYLEKKADFNKYIFCIFPLLKLRGYEPFDRLMAPK